MKIYKIAVTVLLFFLLSCSKDNDKERDVNEMERLLTASPWILTSLSESPGNNGGWIETQSRPACEKDDQYVFIDQGNRYEIRGAVLKCDASEEDVLESGVWTFKNIGKQLDIPGTGIFEVVELTSTRMELRIVVNGTGVRQIFGH